MVDAWRARRREALCRGLHRAVRHALVHLPAADLLRGHEADAQRAADRRSGRSRAALEIAPIQTGWTVIDEFAARFVYFYTGYVLRDAHLPDRRRRAGAAVDRRAACSPSGRCSTASMWSMGVDGKPFISLGLGLIGAAARRRGLGADGEERRCSRRCAISARTRSWSIWRSSSAWRPRARVLLQDRPRSRTSARSRCWSRRPASPARSLLVLGGAPHAAAVPVRTAGLGASSSASRNTRCSRPNSARTAFAAAHHVTLVWIASPDGVKSPRQALYSAHGQSIRKVRRACRTRVAPGEEGRPRLSGGRLVLHLPRLSRAAAAEPQVGRPAGQCRARLLQHAVEAAARHEAGGQADASRGHLRQVRAHVPQQALRRTTRRTGPTRRPTSFRSSR